VLLAIVPSVEHRDVVGLRHSVPPPVLQPDASREPSS
jgi:hypothetical protein